MLVNGIVFRMTVPILVQMLDTDCLMQSIGLLLFAAFFFKSIHDLYTSRFIKSAIKNHRSMP